MHQFLKREEAETNARGEQEQVSASSKLSGYCPLDFFSENSQRIRQSLAALIRTPQNNLRCFQLLSDVRDGPDSSLYSSSSAKTSSKPAVGKPILSTAVDAAAILFAHAGL
jgi:hypothetical protein